MNESNAHWLISPLTPCPMQSQSLYSEYVDYWPLEFFVNNLHDTCVFSPLQRHEIFAHVADHKTPIFVLKSLRPPVVWIIDH
jgi:hypothetical protein